MQNFQIHKCELLPEDIEIVYSKNYLRGLKWSLNIYRTATEKDLEANHYLEEEGQTIWHTSVEILACPYCGTGLTDAEASKKEGFGARKCHSFAGWSGLEM